MKKTIIILIMLVTPVFATAAEGWVHYPHKGNYEPGGYIFLSNVTTICQEGDTMYFGGWTGGIDILKPDSIWERIDYRNTPLPKFDDWINGFVLNKDTIYAATRNGLLVVSGQDTVLLKTSNSDITNSYVTHIAKDKSDNIWLTSMAWFELTKYDGNTFHKYTIPGTGQVAQKDLTVDKNNHIWYLGTRSVVKFDGESFKYWDSTNSPILGSDGTDCLYYNENTDEIYVAVSKSNAINDEVNPNTRLFKIHNEEWEEINLDNMPFNAAKVVFTSLTMDAAGSLFIIFAVKGEGFSGPRNKFMILTSSGNWQLVNIPTMDLVGKDFLPIQTIFIDDQNQLLWIGTAQDGVIKADLKEIITSIETELTGLPNIWIRSVSPNPISVNTKLEFFCEPKYSNSLSIKIYDLLGVEIKDISAGLNYNSTTATGILYFNLEAVSSGLYYLNIKSLKESKTISIYKI